MQLNKMQSVDE